MHLWLDEAMEGPSSLDLAQFRGCDLRSHRSAEGDAHPSALAVALDVMLITGTISAIGGSLVAIAQVDIKRTLSLFTTAHLGLVFIAIACRSPCWLCCCCFPRCLKALLSMSIGGVIASTNCQDITELGGLGSRMPAATTAF